MGRKRERRGDVLYGACLTLHRSCALKHTLPSSFLFLPLIHSPIRPLLQHRLAHLELGGVRVASREIFHVSARFRLGPAAARASSQPRSFPLGARPAGAPAPQPSASAQGLFSSLPSPIPAAWAGPPHQPSSLPSTTLPLEKKMKTTPRLLCGQ